MRTTQLFAAAICLDWLALSIAKACGFLSAGWLIIAALPIYTFAVAVVAVGVVLVLAFLYLTAHTVTTQRKGKKPHGLV